MCLQKKNIRVIMKNRNTKNRSLKNNAAPKNPAANPLAIGPNVVAPSPAASASPASYPWDHPKYPATVTSPNSNSAIIKNLAKPRLNILASSY